MAIPIDPSTGNFNFTSLPIETSENKGLLSLSYVRCPVKMVSECKSYKWKSYFLCLSDILQLPTDEYMWEHRQVISEVFCMRTVRTASLKRRFAKLNLSLKQLRGLRPRVNYTDRENAACWRSSCQHFAHRGCLRLILSTASWGFKTARTWSYVCY
jgi:hypothetical protein